MRMSKRSGIIINSPLIMANQTAVSAKDVENGIRGADYPASKQEIIKHAKDKNTDSDVMTLLQGLPNQTFASPNDVLQMLHGR